MLTDRKIKAYHNRLTRLREKLDLAQSEAFLVSHHTDIEYLTGFIGDDSLLLILPDDSVILSDSRYDEFLDPWRAKHICSVHMGIRHRLHIAIKMLCGEARVDRLFVQGDHTSIGQMSAYTEALAPLKLTSKSKTLAELRMCKDAVEVEAIEQAVAIHEAALDAAIRQLTPGMTELHVSALLDYEMKTRGAFKPSFDAIVGSGPNSSIMHYMTAMEPVREGVLLIDCGAKVNGYCSDLTRTIAIGAFEPKIAEIYPIVLDAQLAAIDAIAAGRICADIDAVARNVITKAGYGEQFGHGLGHGLGKDVHESPYFNDLQTDVELRPGMVMTVEPGIYLPGVGGVRIEDDVLITDSGCRVLSSYPKDIDSAIVEPASVAG